MEQAEEVVEDKLCILRYRMRMYPVSHLFSGNMDQHDDKIDKREQMLEDLLLSFRNLIRKFPSLLAQEKTIELQNQITAMEQEFLVYKDSFHSKITELKSSLIPSMHNLSLSDSFKVDQNAAIKKVEAKLENIMEDLDKLSSKATKVEDWSTATDLAVERAMRGNEKLRNEFDRINTVRREVKELMAEFDLHETRDGLSVQEADLKLVDVEEEVENTIRAVEEQNDARELYSLDEVKVDKIKLPTFSGNADEDYEKFKSDLFKGFAQNRVTQADKLDKLRECQ